MADAPQEMYPLVGSRRKNARNGLVITLLVVAICFVLFQVGSVFYDRWKEQNEREYWAKVRQAADQLSDQWAQARFDKAIVERLVLPGMNPLQVRQSRGLPDQIYEGPDITDDLRKKGVIQIWYYGRFWGEGSSAGFDRYGKVVYVGDWMVDVSR
ncbi:MAG TPA: hypothetical protein VHD62_06280 [Opitutaceae bacterium]|nr:hypothetical protein [Opitutaceae bacterium]